MDGYVIYVGTGATDFSSSLDTGKPVTDAVSSLSSAISAIITLSTQSDGANVFTQTVNRTSDVEFGGRGAAMMLVFDPPRGGRSGGFVVNGSRVSGLRFERVSP